MHPDKFKGVNFLFVFLKLKAHLMKSSLFLSSRC